MKVDQTGPWDEDFAIYGEINYSQSSGKLEMRDYFETYRM